MSKIPILVDAGMRAVIKIFGEITEALDNWWRIISRSTKNNFMLRNACLFWDGEEKIYRKPAVSESEIPGSPNLRRTIAAPKVSIYA